jgi:cleavage stimulation factor subunit 3
MTDEAEKNFLAAQATAMQDYGANGGMEEGGADNSDSEDDYDPSATLHEDYSVPFDVSEEKSTASVPIAPTSVDASVSHALPSTMNNRPSSTANAQEPATLKQFSSSNTLTQNQPRTKGGFVVDDDDEDDDDEDTKDMLDVYKTPNETEADATAFASGPQSLLNSSSTAPVPIHDAVQTPVQANTVSNGASGAVPPSATVSSSDVVAQRGNTVTPLHIAPTSQANIVPIPETVNATPTSAGPKTRLAHDTIGILEDRIKEDPRGDMAAWLELIDELKRRNKKEEVRRTYDNFFKIFPLAVSNVHAIYYVIVANRP